VDRRLILLEINTASGYISCTEGIMISLSTWRYWVPSRRPSILWSNPIPRRDPSPNRYRNAIRACRLFHVFCIVTGPLRSIHSYRSIVLKTTRIRRRKLHFLSKCEPMEPMFLREFLLQSHDSRSESSLRHAVSYRSRATGESIVAFWLDGIEKWIFPCLAHKPGVLSLG
jgi:hypothetical protein